MPAGFNQHSSDIESIVGVQFSIFSPDEIERSSVVEITSQTPYEGNEPKIGGLFDPRMGVLDNGKVCRTCGQTNHGCPGHFGHYRLTRPVYYIQFLPMIMNVLKCICIRCSKLRIDKDLHKDILRRKGEARWKEVLALSSNIKRCGQECEDGCGAPQPDKFTREGIARIVAHYQELKQQQPLEVEYVHRLFRRITDEDVDFMGLSRYWCRPDWMICTVLRIPPPQVRPSVVQDNNQRSEDDLTHKLFDIIKNDKTLQQKIEGNSSKNVIDEMTNVVQYHVATLVDNEIPGVAPSAQRSGRPLKSIQQRLGGKEGRIRYNIQGKRVEFSARSVITPDPNLSVAEIGVPLEIAMNLTSPERVTPYNLDKLYKLIQNGADKWPGAKTIVRADGRMISLKHVNTKELVLYNGDVVNRHLLDNDILLFNRQPTLHKMSMMGHRVKVLPYKTFRMNVLVTRPYNADFDGDEMNAHLPQSYEAMVELEEIAAVPHHVITPRHAKPMIGVYQDTLVGSYRLTQPGIQFTRREFMNLMMWNKRFDGNMPTPRANNQGKERWTGQQVLSELLSHINIEMGNKSFDSDKDSKESANYVKIVQGNIEQGVIDGDIYMKPSKGIIHVTYNDYGPKDTVALLDALQNTIENFLVLNGFSVGISDLIADDDTKKAIDAKIQERKKQIEQVILQVHLDLFDNNTGKTNQQEFEDQVFGILNQATSDAGSLGQSSLSQENRLLAMVRSGSKGEPLNVAQMMACLGQTAIEGKRVPYGFTDRTLPHYKKYDDSAEARGFIESSFIRGLTPQEFFFHAMSGREGLIDTAVKSVTGDTEIVIIENGKTKWTQIGEWIDKYIDGANPKDVEHYNEANMELLNLKSEVYIPTCDENGITSWGKMTAVTRHDPGDKLYEIKTQSGRDVIVTAGKSLLIWNGKTFKEVYTKDVKNGDKVPITMNLSEPPIIHNYVDMTSYFPKTEYVHGTDFHIAKVEMDKAMNGKFHIPTKWWENNNGLTFTLPYPNKARFQRVNSGRSKIDHIKPGHIYAYHAERNAVQIPDQFELNERNGIFIGLFLADGNADILSGYVQITKNNETIRNFVKEWFEEMGIKYKERTEQRNLKTVGKESIGTSSEVRGFSRLFAQFLSEFVGHTSQNKYIPDIAFNAPISFVKGLLIGYFSGDGYIRYNSVEAGSTSARIIKGIAMLCRRFGIFTYTNTTHLKSNNVGTKNILPMYNLHIRSKWVKLFKDNIILIHPEKQEKLNNIKYTEEHINYVSHNDVVLDTITEINEISTDLHPKMYDVSVPSTLNFMIGNGLNSYDTADTGYIQRQLIKSMEDLTVQHDGTVRDANNNIVQYHYGEDGINPTKIETQSLPIGKLSQEEIKTQFGMVGVDWATVLKDGIIRDNDAELITEYVNDLLFDQRMMVEGVFQSKSLDSGSVFAPVNLARWILNTKTRFALKTNEKTDLTPAYVLGGIKKIINRTHSYHKIWCALLRFHLAPHKLIVKERFTKEAFEMLMEIIVLTHMKSWVQPGDQVGIVAAQSIGEPATQMTLNTFHQAGVASKSAVTRGVPRLRELLKVTQNPKATSLTIALKPEYRTNKDKAREVVQDLELTVLRNITDKVAIYWDEKDEETVIEEDKALLTFYKLFEEAEGIEEAWSKWVLRLELNREEMFNRNISIQEVVTVIKNAWSNDINVVYSDYNSDKLMMRIRLPNKDRQDKDTASQLDDFTNLKKFQNKLLNSIVIRGLPGIKAVTFRNDKQLVESVNGKYEQVEQYVLDTDGSNFIKVMNHPAVDGTKLYSTNVWDVYEVLGIEATRAVLYNEINGLFESVGVNYRHLCLLCDVMTRFGKLMSIDRYGINKNDIGTLAKASFEETEKILLKAALFGEVDPVTGVSANIMMGQPIRGGTAFSQILMDDQMLGKLLETIDVDKYKGILEDEEEGDITLLGEAGLQLADPCSSTQFQMNMVLPGGNVMIEEPEIEIDVIG